MTILNYKPWNKSKGEKKLLTNFEKMIPGCDELFPKRQVGPEELGEEDNDGRESKHLPDRENELLSFLGYNLIHAAHTSLKQNWADACWWK